MTPAQPALPPRLTTLAYLAYLLTALVLHLVAGVEHLWHVAALMMILMTVTYPTEAVLKGREIGLETGIALGLSALAVLGLVVSPLLIIVAVFAHGLLDIVKYRGYGIAFYPGYLFACAAFDFVYGAALLAYYLTNGCLA